MNEIRLNYKTLFTFSQAAANIFKYFAHTPNKENTLKICSISLVQIVLVKFLEASVEWETTRKDHCKTKDSIVRRR